MKSRLFYLVFFVSASNFLTAFFVGLLSVNVSRNKEDLHTAMVPKVYNETANTTTTTTTTTTGSYSVPPAPNMTNFSYTATVAPLHLVVANTTIFFITPTYSRHTQKVDLTSLCQTLMHVPMLVWIVIEDSPKKTPMVTSLLARCNVTSVHMNVESPDNLAIEQRYLGLKWVKDTCTPPSCKGVVYFGDDDNKYDLRLFEEIRQTKWVAVMNVAFSGGVIIEGPSCKDGKAEKWRTGWGGDRKFPIDMAGFAVNIKAFTEHPDVWVGKDKDHNQVVIGYMETVFLEMLAVTREVLECRSNPEEVLVWHIRTEKPHLTESLTRTTAIEV